MNLIEKLRQRGGQEEKMLIFCVNLNPLSLLENMLKTKFGWIWEQDVLHIDRKVKALSNGLTILKGRSVSCCYPPKRVGKGSLSLALLVLF
jgi:hypothetical protein